MMIMRPSVNRLPTTKLKLRFIGLREGDDSRPPKMSQCLKWRGGDVEQVSENLVASSFQFGTRLATVFAEEVGCFGMFALNGLI